VNYDNSLVVTTTVTNGEEVMWRHLLVATSLPSPLA